MQIIFEQCHNTGENLLADLGKFKHIPDYLTALADATETGDRNSLSFMPLDCGFVEPGTNNIKWIIHYGTVAPDGRDNIELLSKKPGWITIMLNEHLHVNADAYERELFFRWK